MPANRRRLDPLENRTVNSSHPRPDGLRTGLVVPCYNEETRFPAAEFDRFLRTDTSTFFVLVNDGSTDGTLRVLTELAAVWPDRVRVIDQQPNQGKAQAVRTGMRSALGDPRFEFSGYFDADLATPLDAVPEFVEILDDHPPIDIVMGARVALLGRNIERQWLRHYAGRIFATAASVTLELPVYDTQCGAKVFRNGRGLEALFEDRFSSRWIFDVEIFARYLQSQQWRGADGLYELPLKQWIDVGESKVRPIDFVRALSEMAQLYRRYPLKRKYERWIRPLTALFVRYMIAGGLGTASHYALLLILVEFFDVAPSVAAGLGATLGAVVNYQLNYQFTFTSNAKHVTTFPKYVTVAAGGVVLSLLGVRAGVSVGLHYTVAQILCTGLVLVFGFVLNKLWTFREKPAAEPQVTDPAPTGDFSAIPAAPDDGRSPQAPREAAAAPPSRQA